METVLYVASIEGFFGGLCCIDCKVEEYCAFPNADMVLGIDGVYEKKMVDIGEGILISEPVVIERGLREGVCDFFMSLSHQGILAIYSYCGKDIIQFTDFRNEKQIQVEVEHWSGVTFYDDKMILLTYKRPLREATVEEVLEKQDVSVFEKIGDMDRVNPSTDTSLLHSRRVLCYISMHDIPYEYNVDTKGNKRIDIRQNVLMFSPLMGIDCGVKAVFQDVDNEFTYTLDWDNKVSPLHEIREDDLMSLFVSSTHPRDLSKSALRYFNYLIRGGNKIDPQEPIHLASNRSVVRIYKDIFLLYNRNTKKWVLSRIIIP